MRIRKFALPLLNSSRIRSIWQSQIGWQIVRLLPRQLKEIMKGVHRSILVTPTVLPFRVMDSNDLWDHKAPLLSVVIPCHNYGRYIRQTISSLQSQTFTDFEIIIVDDGSNDETTLQVLHELQRKGIKILRQKKLNAAAALNRGIRTARGRYACCLGADDLVEPTYFEKCLCLLESNPGVAIAYSLVRTFGDESQIWLTQPFDLRLLLEYNYICAAAVFRKVVWEKVGGFDEVMDGYEDWDFWLKAGEAGFRGRLIPQLLFNYRRHGTTLNIRSDRRYQELAEHIREKHAGSYLHAERVIAITARYSDIRVPQPLVNLSLKDQYYYLGDRSCRELRRHGLTAKNALTISYKRQMIILACSRIEASTAFPVARALKTDPILVMTGENSTPDPGLERRSLTNAYVLSLFLDRYCWFDFASNLIKTRSASIIVISGSELAYEWTPKIRASRHVLVVDIVQDRIASAAGLSAKYDAFVDLHVVMSAAAARSLNETFGLSEEKVHLFSIPNADNFLADRLASIGRAKARKS